MAGYRARQTAWPSYLLTVGWLAFSHRLPRSLMSFLGRRPNDDRKLPGKLTKALRREAHAQPLRFAPGEDRNVFVMKTDTARRLGVEKISDLSKYWPASDR